MLGKGHVFWTQIRQRVAGVIRIYALREKRAAAPRAKKNREVQVGLAFAARARSGRVNSLHVPCGADCTECYVL